MGEDKHVPKCRKLLFFVGFSPILSPFHLFLVPILPIYIKKFIYMNIAKKKGEKVIDGILYERGDNMCH